MGDAGVPAEGVLPPPAAAPAATHTLAGLPFRLLRSRPTVRWAGVLWQLWRLAV